MSLDLVTAEISDLDSIMALEAVGFASGIREEHEVFLRRVEVFPSGFILLKINDETAGYLSSEIWPFREPFESRWFELGHDISTRHEADGNELYVSSMTILPQLRGTGLGKLLFVEALTRLKKDFPTLTSCILVVNETWRNARKIYDGAEFHQIGSLPQFFMADGDDPRSGLVCRRSLRSLSDSLSKT